LRANDLSFGNLIFSSQFKLVVASVIIVRDANSDFNAAFYINILLLMILIL
jgi:hypothetical protein